MIVMRDSIEIIKYPTTKGKKHTTVRLQQGTFKSRDAKLKNQLVKKTRRIDKEANLYTEKVVDVATNTVIVDKSEPLDQHISHGGRY